MTRKIALWLSVNIVLLLLPPIFVFQVLDRELAAWHLAHPHAATDGDSLGIPLLTVTLMTLLFLIVINLLSGFIWWLVNVCKSKRVRNSARN